MRPARHLLLLAALSSAAGCLHDPVRPEERQRSESFDLLTKGQRLKADGDLVLARDTFLQAAEKSERPVVYYELGNTYYRLGQPDQAMAYYDKALALSPDYALAQAERDMVRLEQKHRGLAMADPTPAATPTPAPAAEPEPPAEVAALAEPAPAAVPPAPEPVADPAPEPTPAPAPEPTPTLAAKTSDLDGETGPTIAADTPEEKKAALAREAAEAERAEAERRARRERRERERREEAAKADTAPSPTPEPTPTPAPTPAAAEASEPEPTPTPRPTPAARSDAGPFGGLSRALSGIGGTQRDESQPAPEVDPGEVRKALFPELDAASMPTAAEQRAAGAEAERLGRYDAAVRAWTAVVGYEPKAVDARLKLAHSLQRTGRTRRAAEEIEVAERLAPDDPAVHYAKASFHLRDKNREAAREALERTLELDSGNADARNNLGALLLELGKPNLAIEELQKVIDANPQYAAAWLNLALAQDTAGEPAAKVAETVETYLRVKGSADEGTQRWLKDLRKRAEGAAE